jgi:Xaa-Pro aminopeptidase
MNANLFSFLKKIPSNTLCTVSGASEKLRNGDVHYPFRQDSDFLYLTGLSVPNLTLTLWSDEVILWRESITEKDKIWWSDKLPDDEIAHISGITDIRELSELEIYTQGKNMMNEWDVKKIIHTMRMIKTPDEIEKIQKAITLTNRVYEDILSQVQSWMYEYEIEALVAYGFRKYHGIEAFPTIVASGPNGCILHYTKNTRKVQKGDLVLLDFGIEIDGYGADISRTFPVDSNFSLRQQEFHDAVADVKQFAESMLRPWVTRRAWNSEIKEYMYNKCKDLRLKDIETYTPETNPYFPHSIGHFLGLDTHDVGDSDTLFEPWMVLTIEPGIYIREEWIGIREEDDYLVTENGCQKL